MYIEIIPKIKTLLEEVVLYEIDGTEYKPIVYPYALQENETPERYPAIMFFPVNSSSEFLTNEENEKVLNFTVVLIVNAENITNEKLFTKTMPNAIDKVIKKIDKGWDFDSIDNCRTWARANDAVWDYSTSEKGRYGYANINLIIKLKTNNL